MNLGNIIDVLSNLYKYKKIHQIFPFTGVPRLGPQLTLVRLVQYSRSRSV